MYDVGIIGSGPSGLAAALYLVRAGKSVILFEKEQIGGQMAKSPCIENYPGLAGTGGELANAMYDQVAVYPNFNFEFEEVKSVKQTKDSFIIEADNPYEVKKVIYAVGMKHKHLPVPGGDNERLHYCATCDGPLYKNKNVLVIGDANTALQYAIELSNYCNKVGIATMGDCFYGEQELIDTVLSKPNIVWHKNSLTKKLSYWDESRIEVSFTDKTNLLIDGVFVAIGQEPVVDIDIPVARDRGFLVVDEHYETSINGFYAIGDCIDKSVRQVSTAVADGTIAALHIIQKGV